MTMLRINVVRLTMPILLAAAVGCQEVDSRTSSASGDRILAQVGEIVWSAGGAADDTLLLRPRSLVFLGQDLAVWDAARSAVITFSPDGRPKWRYGRKGGGPHEFEGVTQIGADDLNRLWVLDPDNARISILNGAGELVRAFPVPLSVGHVDRLTPVGQHQALLMGLAPVVHLIDDRGQLVRSAPHPYQSYASLHPISAYNRALYDRHSDSIGFFFHYGGGIARTNRELMQVSSLTTYVEPIAFPEVRTQQTRGDDGSVTTVSSVNAQRLAVRAGTISDRVIHLLFEGDGEYGHRVVDRYALGSGSYLDSWILPDSARDLAVRGDLVVTLEENPIPAIVARRAPGSGGS